MIRYPMFEKGAKIGVTAPSSGVPESLHHLLHAAIARMQQRGYNVKTCHSAWTQSLVRSASGGTRGQEFNDLMSDPDVTCIFPPWGGELLIEMLEFVDFEKVQEKWVLGYSDISSLLLAITLRTGVATAHGTNFIDLRGSETDPTTAMWETVLQTNVHETIVQCSSTLFQQQWEHDNPTEWVFHLTEKTEWKSINKNDQEVSGRLVGGCMDTTRHLIGTPYGDIATFQKATVGGDPLLWYFENVALSPTDMKRTLMQMKYAGWFNHCSGIVFGRSSAEESGNGYKFTDVYQEVSDALQVPLLYDLDCGHLPPQVTLVNGAYGTIVVEGGKGEVIQRFKP
ncbi:muramoyltetrapeptide carboxypeptidase [Bacillus sp. JCM 19047]|nr:muramoyltetrapeptide carboxypeptidase [Bacillus sp. JCM 19047]